MGSEELLSPLFGNDAEALLQRLSFHHHLLQEVFLALRQDVSFRLREEQPLRLFGREPRRVSRRAGEGGELAVLGQQGGLRSVRPPGDDVVAIADEQQSRPALDERGLSHTAAAGYGIFDLPVEGGVHNVRGKAFDERMGPAQVDLAFFYRELELRGDVVRPVCSDGFPDGARDFGEVYLHVAVHADGRVVLREGLASEALHVGAVPDGGLHRLQLTGDVVYLHGFLGEDRPGAPLAVGNGVPAAVEVLPVGLEVVVETGETFGEVSPGLLAQEESLEDRLDDVVRALRDWYGDAQGVADGLVFTEKHVEDDTVYLVVRAIVG